MTKVLEEAKDDQGKDVDGIYTYKSTIDGKNYIGITASAIRTGNLNADLITTGTLNADLIKSGHLNADLITTGNLNANLITTGNLLI